MKVLFYNIDSKNVFFENFADENVVVNISKGNYYSMKGSAIEIWNLLGQKISFNQLLDAIVAIFDIDFVNAQQELELFINILVSEQLILVSESQEQTPLVNTIDTKKIFTKPYLEIYSDLQELLLLDPIHEVDEVQGWPKEKK